MYVKFGRHRSTCRIHVVWKGALCRRIPRLPSRSMPPRKSWPRQRRLRTLLMSTLHVFPLAMSTPRSEPVTRVRVLDQPRAHRIQPFGPQPMRRQDILIHTGCDAFSGPCVPQRLRTALAQVLWGIAYRPPFGRQNRRPDTEPPS